MKKDWFEFKCHEARLKQTMMALKAKLDSANKVEKELQMLKDEDDFVTPKKIRQLTAYSKRELDVPIKIHHQIDDIKSDGSFLGEQRSCFDCTHVLHKLPHKLLGGHSPIY